MCNLASVALSANANDQSYDVQVLADAFMMLRLPFKNEGAKRLSDDIFEDIYFAAYAWVVRGNLGIPRVVHWKSDLLTFMTSIRVILPFACFGLVSSLQQKQPQQQTELSVITNSFGKYKHLGRIDGGDCECIMGAQPFRAA